MSYNNKDYQKKYHIANRERLAEYKKQYYLDNKERIKEYLKGYYLENKDKILDTSKGWSENNREKSRAIKTKWRKDNPEKVLEISRQYHKDNIEKEREYHKQYSQDNREILCKKVKEWVKTDKGRALQQRSNYRRRMREKNIINTLTSQEWLNILEHYNYRCAYCDVEFEVENMPHKDHVIPISKGGDNVKENVVPTCQSCNSKKGNKLNYKTEMMVI